MWLASSRNININLKCLPGTAFKLVYFYTFFFFQMMQNISFEQTTVKEQKQKKSETIGKV